MKRDFDQAITDLNNDPFQDKATLKSVVFLVLNTPLEGDDRIPLDQKLKQFTLLQSIHKGGVVDISAEDIAFIKTRAARCPLSLIAIGRLCELLEKEYVPPPDLRIVG